MGGKRKEIGGWVKNFCSRWYRDTKLPMCECMCVCVFMRGANLCCLIFLSGIFLKFWEQS